MIDFRNGNIKNIKADGKELMLLLRGSNKQLLWKRFPEYPYMIIAKTPKNIPFFPHKTSFSYGFTDKYGLLAPIKIHAIPSNLDINEYDMTYSSHGYARYLYNSLEAKEFDGDPEQANGEYIVVGDEFTSCCVRNDSEYENIPTRVYDDYGGVSTPSINEFTQYMVSDAEWSLSDEATGKINLYATQSIGFMPVALYRLNDAAGQRPFAAYTYATGGSFGYWPTQYYELKKQDTAVTVDAGNPLITLSTKKGSTTKITSIRANFDEYKTKYDAATAGKYPKSTYPYLYGAVKLDCKSKSLGIDSIYGLYLVFSVNR